MSLHMNLSRIVFVLSFYFISIHTISAQFDTLEGLPQLTGGQNNYTDSFSDTLTVNGQKFAPVDSFTLRYQANDESYHISGMAHTNLGGQTILIDFGSSQAEYFTFLSANTVMDFQPLVSGDFIVLGIAFEGNNTQLGYRVSDSGIYYFFFKGDADMHLESMIYTVGLGSDENPGIEFNDGVLDRVRIHIDDIIYLKNLPTAANPDIILKWYTGYPENTLYGFGDMGIYFEETLYHASLGDNSDPGLVIKSGVIDTVEIDVLGGGLIFGVLPTIGGFKIQYDHEMQEYVISGEILFGIPFGGAFSTLGLKYTPSFTIESDEAGGIIYKVDTKTLHVESATFTLKDVIDLGGFKVNEVELQVQNNLPVDIGCTVTIPPGWNIEDANIGFTIMPDAPAGQKFAIDSIRLDWTTNDPASFIPVGETGLNIVEVGGALINLNDPKNLIFRGVLGMIYGEIFTVTSPIPAIPGKKEVAPAYLRETLTISAHELRFMSEVDLGAYYSDVEWKPILGEGLVDVDLQWGKSYSIDGMIDIFASPVNYLSADGKISLNQNGSLDALFKVDIQVPNKIPIIGGLKFFSIDGATRFRNSEPNSSYAAGWTVLNLIFDRVHIGMKANLGTGEVSKIGAAEEKAIQQTVSNEIQSANGANYTVCKGIHQFTVDAIQPAAYLQNQLIIKSPGKYIAPWGGPVSVGISIKDHNGTGYNLFPVDDEMNISGEGSDIWVDLSGSVDTAKWITTDVAVTAYTSINWRAQPDVLLTPGQYTMITLGWCPQGTEVESSDFELSTSPMYPRPVISMTLDQDTKEATITYDAYLQDSTTVALYYNLVDSTHGTELYHMDFSDGTPSASGDHHTLILDVAATVGILAQDSVYLYAVIDDHINPPVYTELNKIGFDPNLIIRMNNKESGASVDTFSVVVTSFDPRAAHLSNSTTDGSIEFYNIVMPTIVYGYKIAAFSDKGLYPEVMTNYPGNVEEIVMLNHDYVSAIAVVESHQIPMEVTFIETPVQTSIYGTVGDYYTSLPGIKVYLLNDQGEVLDIQTSTDAGYAFGEIPSGTYTLYYELDTGLEYHWKDPYFFDWNNPYTGRVENVQYIGNPTRLLAMPFAGHGIYFRTTLASDGTPIEGVVVTLNDSEFPGNTVSAVSNSQGVVIFEGGFIRTHANNEIQIAWPEGYKSSSNNLTYLNWDGGNFQRFELFAELE